MGYVKRWKTLYEPNNIGMDGRSMKGPVCYRDDNGLMTENGMLFSDFF